MELTMPGWKGVFILVLYVGCYTGSDADLRRMVRNVAKTDLTLTLEWDDFEKRDGTGENTTEVDYYYIHHDKTLRRKRAASRRRGSSTNTHTCDRIREVPYALRSAANIGPRGLNQFYQKYTEAYGIPVLGSRVVSDDALKRACYVVRFLLADHSGVRNSYFKLSGRVAIMAQSEQTTSIPEHAWLGPGWNARARGLGATEYAPVSTGAEENVKCFKYGDRYHTEDIFLHEFSHGIHLLGAKYAIPGWDYRLGNLYNSARSTGRWRNTYSMSTKAEYFAEGVQSYFEVNAYSAVPNGVHGPVNTRAKLLSYDPALYRLIEEVFPCANIYIKRCTKDRDAELQQKLIMNCNEPKTTTKKLPSTTTSTTMPPTTETSSTVVSTTDTTSPNSTSITASTRAGTTTQSPATSTSEQTTSESTTVTASSTTQSPIVTKKVTLPPNCKDHDVSCGYWSQHGECRKNPAYMLLFCKKSCNSCTRGGVYCVDESVSCPYWASIGECRKNPNYMMNHCKASCTSCGGNFYDD